MITFSFFLFFSDVYSSEHIWTDKFRYDDISIELSVRGYIIEVESNKKEQLILLNFNRSVEGYIRMLIKTNKIGKARIWISQKYGRELGVPMERSTPVLAVYKAFKTGSHSISFNENVLAVSPEKIEIPIWRDFIRRGNNFSYPDMVYPEHFDEKVLEGSFIWRIDQSSDKGEAILWDTELDFVEDKANRIIYVADLVQSYSDRGLEFGVFFYDGTYERWHDYPEKGSFPYNQSSFEIHVNNAPKHWMRNKLKQFVVLPNGQRVLFD